MVEIKNDDYIKVFKLLIELANKDEELYDIRRYTVSALGSYETVHGDRESARFYGYVWVIGLKEVLEKLDECNITWPEGYRKTLTSYINDGYSIVTMNDYVYDWVILPDDYAIKKANITKINTKSVVSDLCCYTYDDELGEAVNKLVKYLEVYPGSIRQLSIETLMSRIDNISKNNYQKVIK